jgi:hypothetical protein
MSAELVQTLINEVRGANEVTSLGSGGMQLICRCPFAGTVESDCRTIYT